MDPDGQNGTDGCQDGSKDGLPTSYTEKIIHALYIGNRTHRIYLSACELVNVFF